MNSAKDSSYLGRMNHCVICGRETANKIACGKKHWYQFMSTPDGIALLGTAERREKVILKARARMLSEDNPMKRLECRKRVSAAHKASGLRPKVKGGNGTGPTKAEWQLMRMFPEAIWNYGIKTGKSNGSGYPPVYKVDIGFPEIKLAVEADGACHSNGDGRKDKDRKKEAFLAGLGWRVLRFSNKQILDFQSQVKILADVQSIICRLKAAQPTA